MMMIKKKKLTADKIYTLFFIRKTDILPIKDVLMALGSSDAKQVFRFLLELARKGIIGLDGSYNICIKNHYVLLQKVLGLRYEASAVFLFTVLKCYKTLIRDYIKKTSEGEALEPIIVNTDSVWHFALTTYTKIYNEKTKWFVIAELVKQGYLINSDSFRYKRYVLNLDKIMREGILDYLQCVHGSYT
jgi:hypothetical protein